MALRTLCFGLVTIATLMSAACCRKHACCCAPTCCATACYTPCGAGPVPATFAPVPVGATGKY